MQIARLTQAASIIKRDLPSTSVAPTGSLYSPMTGCSPVTVTGPPRPLFFVVVLPDGAAVEPSVAKRL
jgi:hypothetical protein